MMKHEKALQLADSLLEIQRLTRLLEPLIEDGRQEFEQFSSNVDLILSKVFPTYTVAFAGPVNSGKSTLLSSLLQEGGNEPIAAVGPSNETFAPMIISYGTSASLLVRYFSIEVLRRINEHLADLERQGEPKHEIAMYKQLRNILQGIQPVVAGDPDEGILRKIDLSGKKRAEITNIIRDHVAQSSRRQDVYGVYKVELTYPGKILQDLHNARFVDLFGFGEPNPLINMKYTRFISEEPIDAVVYVFPDRAVTADFNRLFEIPSFMDEIVRRGRLFIVLNKADAYTDASPAQWNRVIDTFRSTLVRHVPILRPYATSIPVFVLSAASIDGSMDHIEGLRRSSLNNLHSLRDRLRSLSGQLEETASDPSIYLGAIFDLLGILDLLARGAEKRLIELEAKLPEIARLVDSISDSAVAFDRRKSGILQAFRASLQSELERQLDGIDYEKNVRLDIAGLDRGDPQSLFRWMLDSAQTAAIQVYSRSLVNVFEKVGVFIDQHLLAAYREYVSMQDDSIQVEFAELSIDSQMAPRHLSTTVEYSAKDLLRFSQTLNRQSTARDLLARFALWFLRNQCNFDAERGQTTAEIKEQVLSGVQKTVEVFMKVYVCEDPRFTSSFASHICTGGEPTYWQQVQSHIAKLDEVLASQVQITKLRFGLYQDKIFFVSHRSEFDQYVQELLAKKNSTLALVVELA